jgi:catalase-peroxidase
MIEFASTIRVATLLAFSCTVASTMAQSSPLVLGPDGGETSSEAVGMAGKCPVTGALQTLANFTAASKGPGYGSTAAGTMSNGDWWPNQLNLRDPASEQFPQGSPLDQGFDLRRGV